MVPTITGYRHRLGGVGVGENRHHSGGSDIERSSIDEVTPVVENFTVTPTFLGTDFPQTVVAPLFAEEWQVPPPAYDIYINQAPNCNEASYQAFTAPLRPQAYPYGQVLTSMNTLPGDEYAVRMMDGGSTRARQYMNNQFLRHDLARRDNQMRIYKKALNRRFRHTSCNDVVSPWTSS